MAELFLIIFIFTSFSYAGFGDFLKSLGESLTKNCSECDAKFKESIDVNMKCESRMSSESAFQECLDFVKNCECWAGTGNSQVDNEHRRYRFQNMKKAVQKYESESAMREPSSKDSEIREPSSKDSISLEKLDKTEAQAQWRARQYSRQDSIIKEIKKREEATLDSIESEIHALIKNGAKTALILDKCNQYNSTYSQKSLKECRVIQDSIEYKQKITKITALLKANKLEESFEECEQFSSNEDLDIADLCENQLIAKIKKAPKNKIKSVELAKIYYGCDDSNDDDNCIKVMGWIFQNDGKMVLMEDLNWGNTIMVQHTGHIGNCFLQPTRKIPFAGYGKYLGQKTYTTQFGVRQTVPNYQLLWCE
jgi:hypothetical protein